MAPNDATEIFVRMMRRIFPIIALLTMSVLAAFV